VARVYRGAVNSDLEVQVRTGRVASVTDATDNLAGSHGLADLGVDG
jgi:hypothetical protein